MQTEAIIPTVSARRYLGQFVKHFSHKLPFTLLDNNEIGEVRFPIGLCELGADDSALRISLAAEAAQDMETLQDVVARHLVRFAFRETLPINWQTPA